jgi:hypothetical protein
LTTPTLLSDPAWLTTYCSSAAPGDAATRGVAFEVRATAVGPTVYARRPGLAGGPEGAAPIAATPPTDDAVKAAMRSAVAALTAAEAKPGKGSARKGQGGAPGRQRGLL